MSIRVESNAPADLDLENIHALDQLSQQLNASYAALEDEVSDLTQELERVRAARSKELIERERLALRLSALIDSLPGGVLVLDPDHTVILANPQAVELLSAPLLNQNFLRVIEQKAKDISADGKQLNLTSGRLIALSNEVSDHYGDQVVLLTDITDAQQKYQENRRAQKLSAMGETIARLAHQIRTPLSAALLYLGQLKTPILTDARQRASLEKAAQRLKHMEQVINQSLNFVQDHAPEVQDFSLFELLDALRTSVLPIIEQQKGAFSLDMPTQDILINGDQESLLSALVSVAENALDIAMPASLQVTARITPEGLEIVMTDQGPGFDEAIIGQVFDAFFTTRSDGTGLGLALAATIASNHDGQMRAENLPQGGACVTLSLPNTRLTWQQNTQPMQTIERYSGVAV